MQQSPALSGLSRWMMWPSRSDYNATGATGVSMENTTLECSQPLHARMFCGYDEYPKTFSGT